MKTGRARQARPLLKTALPFGIIHLAMDPAPADWRRNRRNRTDGWRRSRSSIAHNAGRHSPVAQGIARIGRLSWEVVAFIAFCTSRDTAGVTAAPLKMTTPAFAIAYAKNDFVCIVFSIFPAWLVHQRRQVRKMRPRRWHERGRNRADGVLRKDRAASQRCR